jgi:hypothetical protein
MGDQTMTATAIRQFLHSLFQSQYSHSLELQIQDLKQEREYFKGRAERLEMMILNRFQPQPIRIVQPEGIPTGGRKTMAQLQQELTAQERAAEEAAKKPKGAN